MEEKPIKALFIEVDTESTWAVASIGPAFLASFLRAAGHEVEFVRVALDATADDLVARVCEAAPGILGLSLTSRQWLRARALMRVVREQTGVPVVAGGLHPTFAPEEVLSESGFDYVCLGEGEEPLLELVEALERGETAPSIPNIWRRGGERPALRKPFEPLDGLPFMARDLLDEQHGVVHMSTQRGCPFPCTYCAARIYNELYDATGADYGRRRSHANVLRELIEIRRQASLSYVIFLDDTFTIHRAWVREFCKVYGAELGLPFSLHARVETVTEELLGLLAAAGCHQITYGVESGSPRVRREVLGRPVENRRFRDVFRWTREAGILVTANYMLGLPGESRDELQQTLDLAEELEVLDFAYFVFYPYPGTQLFRLCREKGYLPDDYRERPANHRRSVLRLPDLTPADIADCYDRFTALRDRICLARHAEAVTPAQRDAVVAHVHERARTG